jgi:hypothetical protein
MSGLPNLTLNEAAKAMCRGCRDNIPRTEDGAHEPIGEPWFSCEAEEIYDLAVAIERSPTQQLPKGQQEGERLAQWMITNSFATGHGDTFEDLLKELSWQVKELRARAQPTPGSEGE